MRGTTRRVAMLLTLAVVSALLAQTGAAANGSSGAPRNVILIIADGLGPEHLELGRLGAGGPLNVDGFPYSGIFDTDSLEGVTDSAAAGTALATGVATNNRYISMAPGQEDCLQTVTCPQTVLERAEANDKATGLITDLYLADATPAVFAAHVEDRGMKLEITQQMALKDIEVLFSGGWSSADLLRDKLIGPGDVGINNLGDLSPYLTGSVAGVEHMYGFFGKNEMAYSPDREEEKVVRGRRAEPTLPQLTDVAIRVLDQDEEDGFFLMVEAGAHDWAGHARDAAWVLSEQEELDEVVGVALEYAASHSDTLVVMTGDHETGGLQEIDAGVVDLDAIRGVTATTEWMWGRIKKGAGIDATLASYGGITDLSPLERGLIASNKEMGIADVLSSRQNVAWGWSGTDEGDHTDTEIPVYADGPGAGAFSSVVYNEDVGVLLLDAVG